MLVLVFIILAGISLSQYLSWKDSCADENPVFLGFLGGISACVAMIAVVITAYGEKPQTMLAVLGLLGTVLFNIMPIKEGLDYQAKARHSRKISGFTRFKLGPVGAWIRHTMVGIGRCARILMYCTLIGIPAVKSMENTERAINAYAKQRELQELKQELDELEQINHIAAQQEREARAKKNGEG